MTPRRSLRISLAALAAVALPLLAGPAHAVTTIHLLALRVQFPKEVPDDFTTGGNGLFDMRTPAQALAAQGDSAFRYPYDLPPHDSTFLHDHLVALRHYIEVASQGQLDITWEMYPKSLDSAYTAPDNLVTYGSGATQDEVTKNWVRFLHDALVVSASDVGDLSRFQSFLVFNASISLQGVLSAELPPLVLTQREISGSGVTIPSAVQTAWFMPQQIQEPGGVIGLNGAFAKTFCASLGLPVLSNTATGSAAVGGWTLMDVGSDNVIERPNPDGTDTTVVLGFVPCLPMAWEQMQLGWLEPAVVRHDTTIDMAGLAVRNTSLPRAVKVPITSDEYFLLELRRSAHVDSGTNPTIVYSSDDSSGVWLYPKDDDYDAYTPGSGVLVWHIDESRIREWEPTNQVNAFPEQPSMFILEADGYRDIGITNQLGNPRASEGIGSPFDPYPVSGVSTPGRSGQVYAWGDWQPGHPVSLANDGSHTGIGMTFAPINGSRDSVAVTIRWEDGTGQQAQFSRSIGGAVAGGVAVQSTSPQIVAVTTDGKVWAFDDTLGGVGSANGFVGQFPGQVTRKPIVQADGSIVVVGSTSAKRYSLSNGSWDSGTNVSVPAAPGAIEADLDRDGVPYDITWTSAGTITATKSGTVRWTYDVGDSIIAQPTVGPFRSDGYGYLQVPTRRTVYVIERTGHEVLRYGLGRADSTDYFTGPVLTYGSEGVIAGTHSVYVFDLTKQPVTRSEVLLPGTAAGAPALYLRGSTPFVVAGTQDGWLTSENIDPTNTMSGQAITWGQLYSDAASSNVLDPQPLGDVALPPADLMPADRAFFYPSPVGNTVGRLRFYLSEQADVVARIYTSTGELAWEGRLDAAQTTPQADNELVWPGGTKFASGLYLCRLVAKAPDGHSSALTIPVGIAK